MPLVDQDGSHAEVLAAEIDVTLKRIEVHHDEIKLFDDSARVVIQVTRPRHPGAGLLVEFADSVMENLRREIHDSTAG